MKFSLLIVKVWLVLTTQMICIAGVLVSFAGFQRGLEMMNLTGFFLIWMCIFILFVSAYVSGLTIKVSIGIFGVRK